MASKITKFPATGESETQNEHKRPLMPRKLITAAMDGDAAYLNQLLGLNNEEEDHPQPSKKEEEEEHPPHTMVSVDDDTPMESSVHLIRSAAGMGDTILHILSANGHEKLVSKICMKDISLLKAHNVRNETPFHHAARFGHKNTISKLIHCAKSEFGEDGLKELLRQKNCLGETALHEAARHDHGAVVSILMEEDIELAGLVNDDSVSPLYLATARRSVGMVHNMVEKLLGQEITPAFYSGPKQQTALFAAVLQGTELTKELLKLYSEPLGKETDETGRTPLHVVASTGNYGIAELLLDKDPSLAYIPDSDRSFPVHTAVRMGHIAVFSLLLNRCPDSGQLLDGNGKNFLHIFIEAKITYTFYIELKFLTKFTIDLKKMINRMANTMDKKGNTPLHLAAEHGYNDVMVSLLKENKGDLTLQNKEGLTAPDIAVIRLRKYLNPTQRKAILGGFYIPGRKARFSRGWFQHYTKEQMSETELIRGTNQDDISTTDTRGAKQSSESLMMKAQFVGLGSVLIATVTFAAAFTLPGGTNQDTGIPILGKKYIFKAFVIADWFAFISSFFSTMNIIYASCADKSDMMEDAIDFSLKSFTIAARSMLIAMGLALYLLLAPIENTVAVLLLSFSLMFGLCSDDLFKIQPQFDGIMLERQILRHIPDEASGVKPKSISLTAERIFLACELFMPIIVTFLVIFLFALI
ncbi:protein ACCELERATED CELL DEATH 6-like [Carex rostrata]